MSEPTLAFTIADAAKASGLGRTSLYELIGAGKLEARKAGNRTLIPADSLRAYLASLPAADIRTGQRRTVA
jgi:excisionase family DNA binding protein